MAAAGLSGGVTVQGLAEGGSRYSDVLEILQQQWAEIGVKININAIEAGAVRARRKAGDYDVLIQGWGTLVDPNEYVGEQFLTTGGLNFGKSGDAKLDALIVQGKSEVDPAKRKAIYKAIEEYLLETSVPMVFLYRPYEFAAFNTKLKDLKHEAGRTRISLAQARLEG
jgi:peptide/nickel transport system substrate-binding protein